jgi:undecaprenyl diphosphate synthase
MDKVRGGRELRVRQDVSSAGDLIEGVPPQRFPRHLAIIMDGNGRWAQARGKPRHHGHRAGTAAVKRLVIEAVRLKLAQLTLYSFSSENWSRPQREVRLLMDLYRSRIIAERKLMMEKNVRLRTIGDLARMPAAVAVEMRKTERITAANGGMVLCLALNYGAHDELLRACRRLAGRAAAGDLAPEAIDGPLLETCLDTAGMSEVDLMIRTGGEERLSNFLLWQLAYAELYFTDVLWPDFAEEHLHAAIREYAGRHRRFGGLEAGDKTPQPSEAGDKGDGHAS